MSNQINWFYVTFGSLQFMKSTLVNQAKLIDFVTRLQFCMQYRTNRLDIVNMSIEYSSWIKTTLGLLVEVDWQTGILNYL